MNPPASRLNQFLPVTTTRLLVAFCLLCLLCLRPFSPIQAGSSTEPSIISAQLEERELVLVVYVPSGFRKLTLESRQQFGRGPWEPRAVVRTDGQEGEVVVRLERSRGLELLRIRAEVGDLLPEGFYQQEADFGLQPDTGAVNRYAPGVPEIDAGVGEDGSSREVVESDIWKLQGDRLFLFNQYRGLQIAELTDLGAPKLIGSYSLPASGEDLYLLGENHVILLARDDCGRVDGGAGGRALVLQVDDGQPRLVASVPFEGYLQESRLVGDALYVAAQTSRQEGVDNWEWGTAVSSFDLSSPESPELRSTLWYPGYGNVASATDTYLFVVTSSGDDWWRSRVHCIDISASDGTMREASLVEPLGRIADQFKMDWDSVGVFRVVSEVRANSGGAQTITTYLETFLLPEVDKDVQARAPKLGQVELGRGERLFATRFAGHLAYVVTYRQVDPLWIVDLNDPKNPVVAGELEVPGWSTYIYPWNDRLITIGIDDTVGRRVSVSLFGVTDPAEPTLLSRVSLGDQYSHSEAVYDEKAFGVLPNAGLILVPYQGSWTEDYASYVQLIDLDTDSLKARGVIEHAFQPRRALLHREHVVSVSGQELLTVDAANRDEPVVVGALELAWTVDRVLAHDSFLLEFSDSIAWQGGQPPSLRVVPVDRTDESLVRHGFDRAWPLASVSTQGDRLVVVQARPGWEVNEVVDSDLETGQDPSETETEPNLAVTVFDLGALPEVAVLQVLEVDVGWLGWSPQFKPIWVDDETLVLAGQAYGGGYWYGYDLRLPALGVEDAFIGGMPYYGGDAGGRFLALRFPAEDKPVLLSRLDLAPDNQGMFSEAFSAGPLVYLSRREPVEPEPIKVVDEETGETMDRYPPEWIWFYRTYLEVVDFTDPANPLRREAVEIPGTLQGLSDQGALLYTLGQRWDDETGWTYDGAAWLRVCAYDGVGVYPVDAMAMPRAWPNPVVIGERVIYLGRPSSTTSEPHALETWRLTSDEGRLQLADQVHLKEPIQDLVMREGLVVGRDGRRLRIFSRDNGLSLTQVGEAIPPGCVWYDLGKLELAAGQRIRIPLGAYGIWSAWEPTVSETVE